MLNLRQSEFYCILHKPDVQKVPQPVRNEKSSATSHIAVRTSLIFTWSKSFSYIFQSPMFLVSILISVKCYEFFVPRIVKKSENWRLLPISEDWVEQLALNFVCFLPTTVCSNQNNIENLAIIILSYLGKINREGG